LTVIYLLITAIKKDNKIAQNILKFKHNRFLFQVILAVKKIHLGDIFSWVTSRFWISAIFILWLNILFIENIISYLNVPYFQVQIQRWTPLHQPLLPFPRRPCLDWTTWRTWSTTKKSTTATATATAQPSRQHLPAGATAKTWGAQENSRPEKIGQFKKPITFIDVNLSTQVHKIG